MCEQEVPKENFAGVQLHPFIPEGIHHKLDAFFEPLLEEIVNLYISGITVNIPQPVNVNNHIIAPGDHTVRALILLGTADIKAHQEIGLHAGGDFSLF